MTQPIATPPIVALLLLSVLSAGGCNDSIAYDPVEDEEGSLEGAGTGAGGGATAPAGDVLETVTPTEALALLEDPPADLVVLDVRTAAEFDDGHLEGAVQIDFYADTFETEIDGLDKTVPYLLYCQSGGRSAQTLTRMGTLGFEEVYEIEGGFSAWSAAGLPVAGPQ